MLQISLQFWSADDLSQGMVKSLPKMFTCWQKGQFKVCILTDKISAACVGLGIKCLFMDLSSLDWLETQM